MTYGYRYSTRVALFIIDCDPILCLCKTVRLPSNCCRIKKSVPYSVEGEFIALDVVVKQGCTAIYSCYHNSLPSAKRYVTADQRTAVVQSIAEATYRKVEVLQGLQHSCPQVLQIVHLIMDGDRDIQGKVRAK